MFKFYNFAIYQLAWFAVILGAARGHAWLGAAMALLVTGIHLWLRREPLEFRLVGIAVMLGLVIDTTLTATGQVQFASGGSLPIAPYWMLALWVAFATTLNHSLRWLMRRPIVAAMAGAVFGPLAYLAGEKLGALSLPSPAIALPMLAASWWVAMGLLALVLRPAREPAARSLPA
jgi:hypothetical protein